LADKLTADTDTCTAVSLNIAVTLESTVRRIEQVPIPLQLAFPILLVHPAKVDPFAAVATRSTVP
jgi:hypothetical protein